jgi:hypothetical protein
LRGARFAAARAGELAVATAGRFDAGLRADGFVFDVMASSS